MRYLVIACAIGIVGFGWYRMVAPNLGRRPAPTPVTSAPPLPTTTALFEHVLKSTASIECGHQVGSGFFVADELLVSNAHVVCPKGTPLNVQLPDGRRLLGREVFRDEWLDVAKVEVMGAHATPLKVGDSTLLEAGEPIAFVGSPRGLEFTQHEGKVSHVGRNYLGVAYIQINASVNPGNSGGPLFNARGEVVGMVSLKPKDAEGIGLALPIEYVQAPEGEAATRWSAMQQKVADANRMALDKERFEPHVPRLLGLQDDPRGGVDATIVELWGGPPHGVLHDFTVELEGQRLCQVRASFTTWKALKEATTAAASRELRWLLKYGVGEGVYVGVALLEPLDCPPARLIGPAMLVLRENGRDLGQMQIDLTRLAQAPRATPVLAAPSGASDDFERARERSWRARFDAARSKIAAVDKRAQSAQREVSRVDNAASAGARLTAESAVKYEELKEVIRRQQEDHAAAQSELEDLERQAANEGVPLEWRR